MELLKTKLHSISVSGLCVLIAIGMIVCGLLAAGPFSFSGAAIAVMVLAIYLRMPFVRSDDIVISLSTAYLLKEMIRKAKTAREQQAVAELQDAFNKAMRS